MARIVRKPWDIDELKRAVQWRMEAVRPDEIAKRLGPNRWGNESDVISAEDRKQPAIPESATVKFEV